MKVLSGAHDRCRRDALELGSSVGSASWRAASIGLGARSTSRGTSVGFASVLRARPSRLLGQPAQPVMAASTDDVSSSPGARKPLKRRSVGGHYLTSRRSGWAKRPAHPLTVNSRWADR